MGGGFTSGITIEILFFYIYIPGDGSPIPGEFITGLEIFLRQFGEFWQVFEKKKKTPLNFVGLLHDVSENEKSVHGGQLFGRFFFYKKLLIVFFL